MSEPDAGVPVLPFILCAMGAMCPKCGYGTRVTSKRWARCKRCGERVRRNELKTEEPPDAD